MPWSPEAPGGRPVRRSAVRSVPGREAAPRWARPARRSAQSQAHRRPARGAPLELCLQPAAVRPAGLVEWLAAWLVRSSSCPQQAGSSAVCRRAAAVPSSGFRQAVRLPAAARAGFAEQASWSAPALAWHPLAGAAAGKLPARELAPPSERRAAEEESVKVAASVQPAASALRVLSLLAEAACVQAAQPWGAAARSGARVRPPEAAAVVGPGAAVEPQQEAVAAEPDAVLQPGEAAAEAARAAEAQRPVVVAEAARAAEVLRPAAEVEAPRVPSARRPAAERPSALPSWRPGGPHLWLAP